MKTFTDSAGRTWTIDITVDTIRRVQSLVDVNLADITSPGSAPAPGSPGSAKTDDTPLLTRLEVDLILLCDVIYAIVKPQADEKNVSDEDFGRALGGEAILAARDAFWGALSDFFRSLRRSDQVRAIEKQTALVQAAVAAADQQIEALDVGAAVAEALEGEPDPQWAKAPASAGTSGTGTTSGGGGGSSSGSLPASSPSTPAR